MHLTAFFFNSWILFMSSWLQGMCLLTEPSLQPQIHYFWHVHYKIKMIIILLRKKMSRLKIKKIILKFILFFFNRIEMISWHGGLFWMQSDHDSSEMTQWLRGYTALVQDPSSVPTTHAGPFKTTYSSSSSRFNTPLWPPQPPVLIGTQMHIHTQIHTHMIIC